MAKRKKGGKEISFHIVPLQWTAYNMQPDGHQHHSGDDYFNKSILSSRCDTKSE